MRGQEYVMRAIDIIGLNLISMLGLAACAMTEPVTETATSNLISISYNSYDSTPTPSPQAIDKAIQHCKSQGGLYANYRGATLPNPLFSSKEVHTFVCEKTKTDDSVVISAQNELYAVQAFETAQAISNAAILSQPTRTACTTVGLQTNCTSY
jgi:hypothetical protein